MDTLREQSLKRGSVSRPARKQDGTQDCSDDNPEAKPAVARVIAIHTATCLIGRPYHEAQSDCHEKSSRCDTDPQEHARARAEMSAGFDVVVGAGHPPRPKATTSASTPRELEQS